MKIIITICIIILIMFILGYSVINKEDLNQIYDYCEEVCFHKPAQWGQDTIGYMFNDSCICQDGKLYNFDN